MDVMMPVLDGFDTTRAIKKDMRYAQTPVLFLTARNDNQSVRDGLLSGGDLYLVKPFDPPELLERLRDLVQKQHVDPRPKTHTVAELERIFHPRDASEAREPSSENRTVERPRTLSEQLAAVGAEPRVRVLAVDDDRDMVNYICTVLRDDYEVIATTDSEQAPDKIIAYQPDIILLDIIMPKLNGFHLSHLIRLNRRLRGAKIIFVSSRTGRESVEKAYALGASDYVEKPFTPEQLKRKLLELTRKPGFHRSKKRIDYSEILRREGE
jgi:DNA-binding response OmpR family regulator